MVGINQILPSKSKYVMLSLFLPSSQKSNVRFVISLPPVLLKRMNIAFLKSIPSTLEWKSMNGLSPSRTPAGILSISSIMKSDSWQMLTFPRTQSWSWDRYSTTFESSWKCNVETKRCLNLIWALDFNFCLKKNRLIYHNLTHDSV